MIRALRRKLNIYGAMAGIVPKIFIAYRAWFWVGIIVNVIAITIYVFFWRAVYSSTTSIAGLNLRQTLNYILLAQVFGPLAGTFLLSEFGYNLREGAFAMLLLRPVDLQAGYYAQAWAHIITTLLWQIPIALIATLLFGLQWSSSPAVWGCFLISVFLGRTVMFFFDWILACLTFYTTEVWGLSILIEGMGLFFSGGLLPLVMMPGWLQTLARSLPFAQTLYVPLSLLSGITSPAEAPHLWLGQVLWIIGLGLFSRLFFNVAVRKITVQGG